MLLIEKNLFNKSLAFGEGLKNANNIKLTIWTTLIKKKQNLSPAFLNPHFPNYLFTNFTAFRVAAPFNCNLYTSLLNEVM
jgi:hypothetical protein